MPPKSTRSQEEAVITAATGGMGPLDPLLYAMRAKPGAKSPGTPAPEGNAAAEGAQTEAGG